MRYPVVIHQEKNSAYGVTVPDIPGCFSAGDTIDEAMENTREAIFAHLALLTEGGGDIANARSIEEHKGNKDFAGGIWALVDANVEDLLGPAERINVTIPKRALQKIDHAAKLLGNTRSGLLTEAALSFITHGAGVGATKKLIPGMYAGKIETTTVGRVLARAAAAAAPKGRHTPAKQKKSA